MQLMLRQPYAVTIARHSLNTHQMRVMMRVMEALQPEMQTRMRKKSPYRVSYTKDGHCKIVLPTKYLLYRGENYAAVKRSVRDMTKQGIEIRKKDEKGVLISELFTNLFIEAICNYRSEHIEVQIHRKLMPRLLNLAEGYTKYVLEVAFGSSSPNVMKMYEFVSHWKDKKEIPVKLDFLREWLGIQDKYPKPKHIMTRILEPAMRELKEKADVWFSIAERITEGRRMLGWKFNIHLKKEPKAAPSEVLSQS